MMQSLHADNEFSDQTDLSFRTGTCHKYAYLYWDSYKTTIVDSRYIDFAYLEQPLISKWKSGFCFNMYS